MSLVIWDHKVNYLVVLTAVAYDDCWNLNFLYICIYCCTL